MNSQASVATKMWSTLLMGTLLVASVLVPLLDREGSAPTPALETEHHAATCVTGHDHTICTQVGANLWTVASDHPEPVRRPRSHALSPKGTEGVRTISHRTTVRSRAPPSA